MLSFNCWLLVADDAPVVEIKARCVCDVLIESVPLTVIDPKIIDPANWVVMVKAGAVPATLVTKALAPNGDI